MQRVKQRPAEDDLTGNKINPPKTVQHEHQLQARSR